MVSSPPIVSGDPWILILDRRLTFSTSRFLTIQISTSTSCKSKPVYIQEECANPVVYPTKQVHRDIDTINIDLDRLLVLTFPAYNATPCSMQGKRVRRKGRRSHTSRSRRPSAQRRGRQKANKNSTSCFAPPISHNTKPYPVTTDCSQRREKGVVFTLSRDPKPGRFYRRPPCRASVAPPAHRRVPPPSATICMSPQAAAKPSQCTRCNASNARFVHHKRPGFFACGPLPDLIPNGIDPHPDTGGCHSSNPFRNCAMQRYDTPGSFMWFSSTTVTVVSLNCSCPSQPSFLTAPSIEKLRRHLSESSRRAIGSSHSSGSASSSTAYVMTSSRYVP
ncbi:hypothetical protein LSAT2_031124 [Lamellibrachia satsuma]|nr:hypothetical protein LSAT2_031124 [Lamellibrachia satsuma]